MRNFLKNLRLNETNVSMLLGIVVVIIVGGLLVNYFKSINKTGDVTSTSTNIPSDQIGTTAMPKIENLPSDYTVRPGDTLWSISESVYGSGYNWVDVYAANKTALGNNPDGLAEGSKIALPKVEVRQVTAVTPTQKAPVSYTVAAGDSLWSIGLKLCQNGYLWPQIARDNKIVNANWIEAGQKLTVTCR